MHLKNLLYECNNKSPQTKLFSASDSLWRMPVNTMERLVIKHGEVDTNSLSATVLYPRLSLTEVAILGSEFVEFWSIDTITQNCVWEHNGPETSTLQ